MIAKVLLVPNLRPRLCCCENAKHVYLAWILPSDCNASSQRYSLTKFTHYDDKKKRARDAQIVLAKEIFKLSHGGPNKRQASGTNQPIKAFRQDQN